MSRRKLWYVYALMLEGDIRYIGMSSNVDGRLTNHRSQRRDQWDDHKILFQAEHLWMAQEEELRLIGVHQPALNVVGTVKQRGRIPGVSLSTIPPKRAKKIKRARSLASVTCEYDAAMKKRLPPKLKTRVREFEREQILQTIADVGTRIDAARLLGITTETLRKKLCGK